jgi:CRP-like cAMP-binding protein
MISLTTNVDSLSLESATVGAEGMVGIPAFLQASMADCTCTVRIKGEAWRISSDAFIGALATRPGLTTVINRYIAACFWVMYRSGACNQMQKISMRAARGLIWAHDRVRSDTFDLTHRSLSQMLGVQRPGVTLALSALQRKGIITSRRGHITVLDRSKLEGEACSCSALIASRLNSAF